ncbi:9140_t:CDS:2 [Funneliformis mosseae]|uniref:9140_t:CDS:1 n=1 Tax=Funneliformis mosseae TaxID=27381 RepID=A0A9N9BP46_FUNMO|nr:9140_t:CDS:2 [Funneliformis mosseae]
MHLQGNDSEIAKLISVFLLRKIEDGEHKLSMSFTKVNMVNLFLTLHVICITDDYFILSRISMRANEIGLELM